MPYAPLPGGRGILPAVQNGVGGGGGGSCRPVLLGGVDLSMSSSSNGQQIHNSHHSVGGLASLTSGPIIMPRPQLPPSLPPTLSQAPPPPPLPLPPTSSSSLSLSSVPANISILGNSIQPPSHHHDNNDLSDAPPNSDVLLALLARNKNLEGK